MIGNQVALIKREIWEHPAVYVTPAAIAVVVALLSIAGVVTISAFDKEVNMALFGASNVVGDAERFAIAVAKVAAKTAQGLTQRSPSLIVAPVRPQQRHQRFAAALFVGLQGEIAEKSPSLSRLDRDLIAEIVLGAKSTENLQPQHPMSP